MNDAPECDLRHLEGNCSISTWKVAFIGAFMLQQAIQHLCFEDAHIWANALEREHFVDERDEGRSRLDIAKCASRRLCALTAVQSAPVR